jgi:hypothetical protein
VAVKELPRLCNQPVSVRKNEAYFFLLTRKADFGTWVAPLYFNCKALSKELLKEIE